MPVKKKTAEASPIDLEGALSGTLFPTTRDDLIEKAKENDAPEAVIVALDHIQREWFTDWEDIVDAFPKTEEKV